MRQINIFQKNKLFRKDIIIPYEITYQILYPFFEQWYDGGYPSIPKHQKPSPGYW